MSIWNKVLVGLIGVASLVLFYLAARTMKTHQYWRELATKYEQRIEQVDKANQTLVEGSGRAGARGAGHPATAARFEPASAGSRPGLVRLRSQGQRESRERYGGNHRHDQPARPPRHRRRHGSLRLRRGRRAEAGRYLGEFRVAKSDEKQKQVTLAPTSRLSPREIERLGAAKGPWVLYETMPRDNHEIFAALSDEEKKAMLPAASLPEYLKDGKAAAGKDARPLRDYHVFFTADRVQRTLLVDAIDAATRDEKLLHDALAEAKQQEEAVKVDLAAAKEEVTKFRGQRDAVTAYYQALEKELAAVRADIARLIETNKAMAGRIAKMQLEAVRRIDERTRAMAQSGAGGL